MAGSLIVITGPSGGGKDAVASLLLKKLRLPKLVTYTTRAKRTGEAHGTDYNFVPLQTFQKMKKSGEFIETNFYGTNWYGTRKKDIESVIGGDRFLWIIDPSRAATLKELFRQNYQPEVAQKLFQSSIVLYITEESQVLVKRLKNRGMSSKDVEKRMEQDKKIWKSFRKRFNYVIENQEGQLTKTAEEAAKILKKHGITTLV